MKVVDEVKEGRKSQKGQQVSNLFIIFRLELFMKYMNFSIK